MIVNNAEHETAIVIRRDGQTVVFVRLKSGKLSAERLTESIFRKQWQEASFALTETLDQFLAQCADQGGTQEAQKGLEKLKARDRHVVANLF